MLDDRAATSTVILDGLLDVGLFDLVGKNLAYVNVSRDFLFSVRPLPLPARRVVLELLEDQMVDDALLGVLAISSPRASWSRSTTFDSPRRPSG